jgi:pilus assembly protein CpaF
VVKLSDKLQQADAEEVSRSSRSSSTKKTSTTKRAPATKKASASRSGKDAEAADDTPKRRATDKQGQGERRWADARRAVRQAVLDELAPRLRDGAVEGLEDEVVAVVDRVLKEQSVKISPTERRSFVQQMISDILGYGVLDELLKDPDVTEVMCNDFNEIWVERDGIVAKADIAFADRTEYRNVIEKIVSAVGRRVDESSPMVDARLPMARV